MHRPLALPHRTPPATLTPVSTPASRRRPRPHSRGVSSVLAMLYLVLFSTMALGFYATVVTSGQIAHNERETTHALLAAGSGTHFLRYHLSALDVPAGLSADRLFEEVYMELASRLDGTGNLGGASVGYDGSVITIPETGYIKLDDEGNQRFRITLTRAGDLLVANVEGRGSKSLGGTSWTEAGAATAIAPAGRGIELVFQKASNASAIFNYGVASRGAVSMSGNIKIQGLGDPTKGSVLVASSAAVPLTTSGTTTISGDLSFTNAAASPSFGGNVTVAGYAPTSLYFPQHVHKGIPAPEFPTIDTTPYAQYATNTWTTATGNTIVNCVIPANANPTFGGNVTVQGVLYIKTPNKVTFSGNTTIHGCVVVENNPQGTANTLTFSGNVTAKSINTLPATAQFPPGERALTGAFLLAPGFAVSFSGNFGTIGGSMIADRFTFSGNAGGTVSGSVISLKDVPLTLSGNSVITIASVGTTEYPPGVSFGMHYTSIPGSYLEIPTTSN